GAGMGWGRTWRARFWQGTEVTVSGAADANSTFAGWSGGACVGTAPCTVTLNADTTISAGFVANTQDKVSLLAAVLPNSRSLQVGKTGTVFATVINTGTTDGSTCAIAPATGVTATFAYQTTN